MGEQGVPAGAECFGRNCGVLKAKLWRPRGWIVPVAPRCLPVRPSVLFGHQHHHDGKHDGTAVGWATAPAGMGGQMDVERSPRVPPPPIPSRPTQHSSGTMLQEALRPTHFPWGEVLLTSLLVPWGGHGMRVGGSLPAPGVWGRSLATAPGSAIVFLALALLPFSSSSASCSGGVGPALALLPARLLAAVGGSARGAQRGVPVPPPLQLCPSQVPALRWYVLIRSPVPSSEPRQRLWGAK